MLAIGCRGTFVCRFVSSGVDTPLRRSFKEEDYEMALRLLVVSTQELTIFEFSSGIEVLQGYVFFHRFLIEMLIRSPDV